MNDARQKIIDDLLKERSLSDIFKSAPGVVKTKFNLRVFLLSVLLLMVFVVLVRLQTSYVFIPDLVFVSIGRHVIDFGVLFSLSVLGLLLAGFAIFSTLSNPALLIPLARSTPKSNRDLSHLKIIVFTFVSTIVHLISCLAYLSFLQIIIWPIFVDGILGGSAVASPVTFYFVALTIVSGGGWIVLLFLKLKSFIWNLYQLQILVLTDVVHREEDQSTNGLDSNGESESESGIPK